MHSEKAAGYIIGMRLTCIRYFLFRIFFAIKMKILQIKNSEPVWRNRSMSNRMVRNGLLVKLLIIGSGGFVGAICRYLLAGLVTRLTSPATFPYGTLIVNITGCLLIGFGGGLIESRQIFSPEARAFVFIGLLGSFTTFSTFGLESFKLAAHGQIVSTLCYIGFHLILGLSAVWLGHILSRFI